MSEFTAPVGRRERVRAENVISIVGFLANKFNTPADPYLSDHFRGQVTAALPQAGDEQQPRLPFEETPDSAA
jgi:hypothetical protein